MLGSLLLLSLAFGAPLADASAGPQDLALTFASPFDGSDQPYRLYLPTAYDGAKPLPLLVALHGTGGDQNKYLDHPGYAAGIYKTEAEKRGIVVLCPRGTDGDGLPTEWRGAAELNVLAAIEDVQRRFRIDSDRIVCTGQSMGGTGTTYLCCRYPDLFAAGIPLASTYGHLDLVTNLRDVPMFYVQGANDWPIYAATGPTPLTREMQRLGYRGELWLVAGAGHNTMDQSTPRVLDWALKQRRNPHPRHITHRAYFPSHGRAWWLEIQEIQRPGWFAEVDARVEGGNRFVVKAKNAAQFVLRPEAGILDGDGPISVRVDDADVYRGACRPDEEVLLARGETGWKASVRKRHTAPRTEWRNFTIGTVDQPPAWEEGPETTLGNLLADSIRDITGADIAIVTKGHYRYEKKMRGVPIRAGQTLHGMELINWLRPLDTALATFDLKGSELLQIMEDNLLDGPKGDMFLVQVSGCRYRFDRRRAAGERIVESDLQPNRTYRIACNSAAITRGDTLKLGDRFGKLNEQMLEPNLTSAVWRYVQNHGGHIQAKLEGRVSEVVP